MRFQVPPILLKYYLLSGGFNSARMGIGAVSVIYMLSFGISLGDIALIKIFQGAVIFFSEIPSGLISDKYGRKFSVLCACLCSLISFVIFLASSSTAGFASAEIFNGLCLAFWSGSFEALMVDELKEKQVTKEFHLESVFAKIASFSAFTTMLGGLIGGLLGEINLLIPFYFASLLMLIVLVYCYFQFPAGQRESKNRGAKKSFSERIAKNLSDLSHLHKKAWQFSLSSIEVRNFFLIQIGIQFAMQPMLHYWQPYFQEVSENLGTSSLGILFFLYVLGQFLASGLVAFLYDKQKVSNQQVNTLSTLAWALCSLSMILSKNFFLSALSFVIAQSFSIVLRNNLAANFNRIIPSEERASILSTSAFVSRIGMIINLLILKYCADKISISNLYITSVLALLFIVPLMLHWNRYIKVHTEAEA